MFKNSLGCREKIENFFKPRVWWFLWTVGSIFLLRMFLFNVILLFRYNYGLPGDIAVQDMTTGKLIFFAVNTPLTFFTCLLAGHVALALYKMNKWDKS